MRAAPPAPFRYLKPSRYWVAPLPLGNGAPEEPYVRAFPAYGSSTVLNVA